VPSRFESVGHVLAAARQMNLPNVMVVSELADGRMVLLESPDHTLASANWVLDRAKMVLLLPSIFDRTDDPPPKAG
jgi:hypothetical protein